MSIEIISGCNCCGSSKGRINDCDLKNLFSKLYFESTNVANLKGYINPNVILTLIIDNTGSITESQWDQTALNQFTKWLNDYYGITPSIVRINNYVYNMEDWIYDCYREAIKNNDKVINIIMHTMDSSVHYNETYNYSFTTTNTDRSQPGNQITNHKQLYEYDCNIYNQLVQTNQNTIFAIGNIIGKGGSYTRENPFNQVLNPNSSLRPINTSGKEATLILANGLCTCYIVQKGIREFEKGWQYISYDFPNIKASFVFEDSYNCNGSNSARQGGNFVCDFELFETKNLIIKVYGDTENQSSGFDKSYIQIDIFNSNNNTYSSVGFVSIEGTTKLQGCTMGYQEHEKTITLLPGIYRYTFSADTVDNLYHKNMVHTFEIRQA